LNSSKSSERLSSVSNLLKIYSQTTSIRADSLLLP